ncbi:MAG: glycerate kinase, partial [Bacteroidota bacterium]
ILFPMADGGEGTSEILRYHSKGQRMELTVSDPLGRPIIASYSLSANGQTAFMEMAQAAGLQLLQQTERNPLLTSTYGVGEMIVHAMEQGVQKIVLGIGGSATNDAGMGMAAALGYRFLDKDGAVLVSSGQVLNKVFTIDKTGVDKRLSSIAVELICDVDNPLFGPQGAAVIYAAQKGANDAMIQQLDSGLRHFAEVIQQDVHVTVADQPGAGAAGGLGAGGVAFLGAQLRRGIELIMELT